jgi:transcriptional regulator with XRE-family HTH domain
LRQIQRKILNILAILILRHIIPKNTKIAIFEHNMTQKTNYTLAAVEDIERDLGQRLEAIRLAKNINQTQLAEEAGVSRRTITRLENGEGVSLDTLIRVLRALDLSDRLVALLPDPGIRPIDRVRLKGHERKRARPKTNDDATEWRWADKADPT